MGGGGWGGSGKSFLRGLYRDEKVFSAGVECASVRLAGSSNFEKFWRTRVSQRKNSHMCIRTPVCMHMRECSREWFGSFYVSVGFLAPGSF